MSYLKKLTLDLDKEEQKCANRLLNYILKTQKKVLIQMQEFTKYDIRGFLKIDFTSRRNLELLETIRFQNKKNTLFYTLNKTKTAMGARFLKRKIVFPGDVVFPREFRRSGLHRPQPHHLQRIFRERPAQRVHRAPWRRVHVRAAPVGFLLARS